MEKTYEGFLNAFKNKKQKTISEDIKKIIEASFLELRKNNYTLLYKYNKDSILVRAFYDKNHNNYVSPFIGDYSNNNNMADIRRSNETHMNFADSILSISDSLSYYNIKIKRIKMTFLYKNINLFEETDLIFDITDSFTDKDFYKYLKEKVGFVNKIDIVLELF